MNFSTSITASSSAHAHQPVHHLVERRQDLVVVEVLRGDRRVLGPDLFAAHLIAAAVDRIQQGLGGVDPGLLPGAHVQVVGMVAMPPG